MELSTIMSVNYDPSIKIYEFAVIAPDCLVRQHGDRPSPLALRNLYESGLADGRAGLEANPKHMYDDAYLKGYVVGMEQWAKSLSTEERQRYLQPVCGMCLHYDNVSGRCTLMNYVMPSDDRVCISYEEGCQF